MKYFYDLEFRENGMTIDLISIGIVAEDGREYYAINKDADWTKIYADDWLMKNVVPSLPHPRDAAWKHKAEIAMEVEQFLYFDRKPEMWGWYSAYDHVALCQLWGRMIDLPGWMPMFTHDLRAVVSKESYFKLPKQADDTVHNALEDARHLKVRHDAHYGDTSNVPQEIRLRVNDRRARFEKSIGQS